MLRRHGTLVDQLQQKPVKPGAERRLEIAHQAFVA